MNFIRYDRDTGLITGIGYMQPQFVQSEINRGEPTLFVDQDFDRLAYRVNLQTKEIERIPQEVTSE